MTAVFQTQINAAPAAGVPGDRATLNPAVYTVDNPLAEGPVTVGTFVWSGTAAGQAKNSGTGAPLGFVERVQVYRSHSLSEGATLTVPAGSALTVARRGDYYAAAATAATAGQAVFAVLADGTLKTGAAGAAVDGAVETGWTVVNGGAAGETIIISTWS